MTKVEKAAQALAALRKAQFGRDTWMAAEEARLIVKSILGHNKYTLIDQVILIERASKKGLLKEITGNNGSQKGGKHRISAKKIPLLPDNSRQIIKETIQNPELLLYPSERSSWLKSEDFQNLCRMLPQHHQGEVIREAIGFAKDYRKNNKGVYFNRDPIRPDEYNVGVTSRSPAQRLADTGSKGRHWETVAFIKDGSENEVHKILKPWINYDGRGSETYIFDAKARAIIKDSFGIILP